MKVAVVGATGMVGKVMCQVLEERNFPVSEFIPVASERSVGKHISLGDKEYAIVSMNEAIGLKPDIALFSAGGGTSLEWAPQFEAVGTTVIDNSSAWRMDPEKKLIVPEINAHLLTQEDKIIANPNCSTIQMVMALYPLHKIFTIKRLVISTYQSITGTGVKAVRQYDAERAGQHLNADEAAYPYPIFENCIPHCDIFLDNDYTKEEMKLVHETRKIMDAPDIGITATAVRVPVKGGHSENVNISFEKPFNLQAIKEHLSSTPGVVVVDDKEKALYPMPLFSKDTDDVYVGRIRRDDSAPNSLNLWIVSDNLRKGAATNAIQIAEYLTKQQILKANNLKSSIFS